MASIPSGSTTLFVQAWVPAGWTRDLSYDDYGLRVTSTPGSDVTSGSGWSTVVASSSAQQWVWPATVSGSGGVSLSVNPAVGELPTHSHTLTTGYISYSWGYLQQYPGGASSGRLALPVTTQNTTSGATGSSPATAHTHPVAFVSSPSVSMNITIKVKYIDAIIATRN